MLFREMLRSRGIQSLKYDSSHTTTLSCALSERVQVIILGGDKSGDKRWYKTSIPVAEKLYAENLEKQKKEDEEKTKQEKAKMEKG